MTRMQWSEFALRAAELAVKTKSVVGIPDAIVCLARGGFYVGAYLAEHLSVSSERVFGVPITVTEMADGKHYDIDASRVMLALAGLRTLVVDDGTVTGGLLIRARNRCIEWGAGQAHTCAMFAALGPPRSYPDVVGTFRSRAAIPYFPWEQDT